MTTADMPRRLIGQSYMQWSQQRSMSRLYKRPRLLLLLAVVMVVWTVNIYQATSQIEKGISALTLERRQLPVSPTDQNLCLHSIYCKPLANDDVKDKILVIWNKARFIAQGQVTVRLVAADGDNEILFEKNFSATETASDRAELPIVGSFFSPKPEPGQTVTRLVRFLIGFVGNPTGSPSGPTFRISMSLPQSSSSGDPASTSTSAPSNSEAAADTGAKAKINTPIAIVIGIAGALVITLIGVFLIAWVRKRKTRSDPKPIGSDRQKLSGVTTLGAASPPATDGHKSYAGGASIDSSTPLASRVSQGEGTNITPDATSPNQLSTGDAALIAATFRQLLRKPSWKEPEGEDEEEEEEEGESRSDAKPPQVSGNETIFTQESLSKEGDSGNVSSGPIIRINDAQLELDTENVGLPSTLASDPPTKSGTR